MAPASLSLMELLHSTPAPTEVFPSPVSKLPAQRVQQRGRGQTAARKCIGKLAGDR